MNQIIMWIMAVGAVLGGVDRIAGNRFGLGKRFEEGFTLLGPTALSMSGIICLTPLLSRFLRFALVPIWNFFGLDADFSPAFSPLTWAATSSPESFRHRRRWCATQDL